MPLSWNEIRQQAAIFVSEWKEKAAKAREEADAQDFQTDFLKVFGVSRRLVSNFEHRVNMSNELDLFGEAAAGGRRGYIDLFWKGQIMIEMKTPGKDRKKAYEQARDYALHLPQNELPHGILISDFLHFDYYDLEKTGEPVTFLLDELPQKVELFGFLAGYGSVDLGTVSPVDIEAAEHMGELHDALKENGYEGHELEMYLVRLLFCLFAEDSGIFDEKNLFYAYIRDRTNVDGSDLAYHLAIIFDTLNKPYDKRLKNIDETLNKFPYVNGGLFEEKLETAAFTSSMRKTLLKCCTLDWSQIKPEIFGAMFQSVKDKESRRALGEHYTSEKNILKVIKPLFLDNLWDEFIGIKSLSISLKKHRLLEFHNKLHQLKFLDPACGCGNFLVVSYRELRILEIEVLAEYLQAQQVLDIELMVRVNVDQFFGIEIEEFPARIAQTALWLMDHLMNKEAERRFGKYKPRIPLTASPTIIIGNALTSDWESVIVKTDLNYILGNPPFLGAAMMTKEQKNEAQAVYGYMGNYGVLDYVTCWYKKAADYISDTAIECAFVSTNSICQGEQVPVLWSFLMNKYNIKINFAHQTFKWHNEAKGKAAVYCVIVGFSVFDREQKYLYHYLTVTGEPLEAEAKQINAYLIDAPVLFIEKRTKPLYKVSEMVKGSSPTDDGNFILSPEEKDQLLQNEPYLSDVIRPYTGAKDFLHNQQRYCIWLHNVSPAKYNQSKEIMSRLAKIKKFRAASDRVATLKYADFPSLFVEIRQPETDYLIVPRVSSENRDYIPVGFIDKNVIASDSNLVIPNASLYEFGVITSVMHMAWMRYVCGRLKSDYRYSNTIVYNNFPWPSPSEKQNQKIIEDAEAVLQARKKYPELSLAQLYDTTSMLPELLKAHKKLDKSVETAYGRTFTDDSQRVAFLFERYQIKSGELFVDVKKRGKGRKI